jgi:hypothetical protein
MHLSLTIVAKPASLMRQDWLRAYSKQDRFTIIPACGNNSTS